MLNVFLKILDRKYFLYFSIFYLLYKYTIFSSGSILTFLMFIYAILIFIKDIIDSKGIYRFRGYSFSYLICFSCVLSCLVVAKKIDIATIKGFSIFFINFFMYLPIFHQKDKKYVIDMYKKVFISIIIYSFFKNSIALIFASLGIRIENFFGAPFGAKYGMRLVSVRETANETGWFAIFSLVISLYFYIKYFSKNRKEKNKKIMFFLFLNMIIQFLTFILSGNRSSVFGLFFAFSFIFFIYFLKNKNIKLLKISTTLFFFMLILGILYVVVRVNCGIGSDIVRFDMYRFGIFVLPYTNLIFGSSFSKLSENMDLYFDVVYNNHYFKTSYKYLKELAHDSNAHNVFIQQLNTNGLLGFLILFVFFIYVLISFFKYIKKIVNFSDSFIDGLIPIFFIVFGFVVGNMSWNIVSTMTCFVNLLFMMSISLIINQVENNYSIEVSR